jgi:hypothetical protein
MAKRQRGKPAQPDVVMQLIARHDDDDVKFVEASDEVVGGYDLASSSNRFHGRDVFVATVAPQRVDAAKLVSGARLRVGARERLARGELRVGRDGADVTVAVYDGDRPLTRVLRCASDEDELDEGRFAWFAQTEHYCTPWSDGGPAYCQVVTVERLRRFGGGRRGS